jgi:hypothetical protein
MYVLYLSRALVPLYSKPLLLVDLVGLELLVDA